MSPSVPRVYSAEDYGLDPNDPSSPAWVEWFRAQGWDPKAAAEYIERVHTEATATHEADTAAGATSWRATEPAGSGDEPPPDRSRPTEAWDSPGDTPAIPSTPEGSGALPASEAGAQDETFGLADRGTFAESPPEKTEPPDAGSAPPMDVGARTTTEVSDADLILIPVEPVTETPPPEPVSPQPAAPSPIDATPDSSTAEMPLPPPPALAQSDRQEEPAPGATDRKLEPTVMPAMEISDLDLIPVEPPAPRDEQLEPPEKATAETFVDATLLSTPEPEPTPAPERRREEVGEPPIVEAIEVTSDMLIGTTPPVEAPPRRAEPQPEEAGAEFAIDLDAEVAPEEKVSVTPPRAAGLWEGPKTSAPLLELTPLDLADLAKHPRPTKARPLAADDLLLPEPSTPEPEVSGAIDLAPLGVETPSTERTALWGLPSGRSKAALTSQPEGRAAPTLSRSKASEEIPAIRDEDILEMPASRPGPARQPPPPRPLPVEPSPSLAKTVEAPVDEETDFSAVLSEAPIGRIVQGTSRVVIHTIEGDVRRGTVIDVALEASDIRLLGQSGGGFEVLSAERIKAIFFMLTPGDSAPPPEGRKVRVTFRDGRQLAGFSPDYDPERPGFFITPADTRTHTARIWVYKAAIRNVSLG